jgi:hypothetical protein
MESLEIFINKYLDQRMYLRFTGIRYEAIRTDPDGYETRLTFDRDGSMMFVERMLSSGWEKVDGH